MSEENEIKEWLEPSPLGSEFMRHQAAIEPAGRVPVGKSFAIAPGYNVGILRRMADSFKPKRIVVIDHGEVGFEVRRLDANADMVLFYSMLDSKNLDPSDPLIEQVAYLKRVVSEFPGLTNEQVLRYDPQGLKLQSACCIGYAFFQRKSASVAAFRKDTKGSSKAIKAALSKLEAEGVLTKLSQEETLELFDITATVYRINKEVNHEA